MVLDFAILIVFPAAMAFAAAMDFFTMTIPNRLSMALVIGFCCLAPFVGMDLATLGSHVASGTAMLAIAFVFFAMGWIGGGDAKLFAASALWIGHQNLMDYAFATALLGGVLTLAFLGLRMTPLPAGLARQEWIARLYDPDHGVPYGIALAGAGLLVYPHTIWMSALAG